MAESIPLEYPHYATLEYFICKRFWSKVDIRGDNECWLWLGSTDKYGYGQFKPKSGDTPKRSHRLAYMTWHEIKLPSSVLLLHSCDNPPCCNPTHLSPGTVLLNFNDCEQKGRRKRDHRGRFAKS
jgi:hypothetical protein